jgi:hypothetical protein
MRYWRSALLGAALCVGFGAGASSCGGGNSAGEQFCHQWATDFCNELYACTPTDMRGSYFLGGTSQAQCVSLWSQSCSTTPPQGTQTLVNCSGGVHVNTAAEALCHQELTTITCDEFNSPTYVSVCDQVCGGSQGSGSGGTTGAGGTTGLGGTTSTGGTNGGTGGTSGTGGSGAACGTVEPCGGSLPGTWSFTSECINMAELTLAAQQGICSQAIVSAVSASASGTASFNANLSYSISDTVMAFVTYQFPVACAGGLTCLDYGVYQAATLPAGSSFTCSGTAACVCTELILTTTTDSGTYSTAGSDVYLTSAVTGTSNSGGYCVQGSTLHLITIDPTMNTGPGGQPTIVKDVVAQKQ